MREIKFNYDALIRIFIMIGFVFLFLYLWASGRALNFVHPRMTVFVLAAAVVFAVLAAVQLPAVSGSLSIRAGWWRRLCYLFFLAPLLLGFTYSGQTLSSDFASRQGGGMSVPAGQAGGRDQGQWAETDQKLVFDEVTYAIQLMLIYQDLEAYLGREVELAGFVYHDELFPVGQFAVARYIITCCAADAQVVGLLCRYDTELADGVWIRVSGTIEQGERDGVAVPVIEVRHIEVIAPLENPYIYF